jgi:hypothetical protein
MVLVPHLYESVKGNIELCVLIIFNLMLMT